MNILKVITASVFAISFSSEAGFAQIKSEWYLEDFSMSGYSRVMECAAAVSRAGSTYRDTSVQVDTMPVSKALSYQAIPPHVKNFAKNCVKQLSMDSVNGKNYLQAIDLYLRADMDADAEKVIDRMMKLVEMEDSSTRGIYMPQAGSDTSVITRKKAGVHFLAMQVYLNARPTRIKLASKHLDKILKLEKNVAWTDRMDIAFALFSRANLLQDSVGTGKAARAIIQISDSLNGIAKTEKSYISRSHIIYRATRFLDWDASLDSLKAGTDRFVSLQRSMMGAMALSENKLGTSFEPLAAEYKFPASASAPVIGKTSLVIVADEGTKWVPTSTFSMLKRLKGKFPQLEIVISTRTRGVFGVPLEPEKEAEMRREWIQEFAKAPVSLMIEKTPFWRIPAPDKRYIMESTPNMSNYGNRLWLIDSDGKIVCVGAVSHEIEGELGDMVGVLLKR